MQTAEFSSQPPGTRCLSKRQDIGLFALAIFSSAFLLFQVQPLIAKFILPWFGGGPGVWTTCLLFFQVLLLGGYAYAHFSVRRLAARGQALLHLALLAVAVLFLPIVPEASWKPVASDQPAWRILTLLLACVGLPYFVLAATGPLLQSWFSRVQPAVLPYRLYAVSNVGSLLALISYPFLFEPVLSRQAQALAWSGGLVAFALLCGLCAVRLWWLLRTGSEIPALGNPVGEHGERATIRKDSASAVRASGKNEASPVEPITGQETLSAGTKWLWVGWPAGASVLLLATTNKICQDISVIPFLWVLPLSLYLLTFIVCFDSPRWYQRKKFVRLLWPALALAWFNLAKSNDLHLPWWVQIGAYVTVLFLCCMVCHGEVYRLKPAPEYLTAFYLSIAAGGALGGLFVSVIAPLLFDSYIELPLGWWFCASLIAIGAWKEKLNRARDQFWLRPSFWQFSGALALAVVLILHVWQTARQTLSQTRNFYGVLRVVDFAANDPTYHAHLLICGEITHGFQFLDSELALLPTSYYHPSSGIGLAFRFLPRQEQRRVGVVGLGIGTLAAYGLKGDVFRFYEINPEVKRLAETHFRYLTNSAARFEIALGDARLSLEQELPQAFDLLVLDAFNGDAIPIHLLTRQAFEVYSRHIKDEGVMAIHLTNRHLDLVPVIGQMARHFGLHWQLIGMEKNPRAGVFYATQWALLSRNQTFIEQPEIRLAGSPRKNEDFRVPLWTDDYASLLPILKGSTGGRVN